MKKTFLILIIALFGLSIQSQTLKGYTIGEQLNGDKEKFTTVAGISGVVLADVLNDNRICSLSFIPSEDGIKIMRISYSDLTRFAKSIETYYNIKLIKITEEYSTDIDYYKSKDFSFFISCDHNQFMDKPYEMSLYIADKTLIKIKESEKQSVSDKDF